MVLLLASRLVVFSASGAPSPRLTGAPIVQVFSERDVVGSPHTRRIAVDPAGLIYIANVQGLAEYDGVSWRLIPHTEGVIVHNLAIDSRGQVWYSAKGQFGRLVPDERGTLVAQPWQTKLPAGDQAVGQVTNMAVHGRDVYFVTQGQRSFLVHVDAAETLPAIPSPSAAERFVNVFVLGNATYAMTSFSVYRVEGDQSKPAPEAEALASLGVQSVWPRSEGGAWVVSSSGLRLWRDGAAPLVSSEVSDFLKGGRVMCGCPLADGTFALGTEQYGLLIVDTAGHLLAHYDEDNGLGPTANRIEALATDFDGGLWLALYAGVSRIQIQSPAAIHDLSIGVRGRIECFAYYQDQLHVGTTQGVFVRDPQTGKFRHLADAGVDAWALLVTSEGLIVAGNDLRLVRPDGTIEIIESQRLLFRSALLLPHDSDRLVASTGPGQLRIYHRVDGRWQFETLVPAVRDVLFDLRQDADGWLWAAADNRRSVIRLDWRRGVNPAARPEFFGPSEGLPFFPQQRRNLGLFLIDGQAEVTSINGLWRWDARSSRFVPEDRIAGFDPLKWSRAFPLEDGSLWLANLGEHAPTAIARRTGLSSWRVEPIPFLGFESNEPRVVFDDPSTHTVWLGYQGLSSYDREWHGGLFPPPVTHLRKIRAIGGGTLWGGAGPLFSQPLPPFQNSLRFDFAAAVFQPDTWSQATPEYRTRLAGLEADWTSWSSSAHRDYSRLPPGSYTFQVQARDKAGRVGPVTDYAFSILSPWWRSWWAFCAYAGLIILAIAALVHWRTSSLETRARSLEAQVASRTAQLARQNQELIRLHQLELDEKIAARLAEEKARLELLRYQLNPHFLFNTLTSISAAIPVGGSAARQMVLRLSEFCRLTLHRSGNRDWVSLGEEIRLLRTYLTIEQSRWGELLQVEIDCPPFLDSLRIPQFLLLPLVENALKYGRATSPDRVGFHLAARRSSDEELVITVANTGTWIEPAANSHASSLGIGLENLRERLTRYYTDSHRLEFTHANGWVIASLRLPIPSSPPVMAPISS